MIIVIPDDAPGLLMASALEHKLRELGELTVFESPADTESLLQERLAEADVALTLNASNFTREVISKCPALRHIIVFGIGVDHVDLEACRELGITVSNTPAYSAAIVAEKAIALALAVAHRIPQLDRAVRCGKWPQEVVGQLQGKILGVVGVGPIGQRVAELGKALGMEVIAWTLNPSPQRALEYRVTFVSLEELSASADVISLQLPLTSLSLDLIGSQQLGLMKSSTILVNVGRGAVVDEEALVGALENGRIGGAGLDVFSTEPLPPDHPFRHLDNVVLSPHNAANTSEANRTGLAMAIQNIRDWQKGDPKHLVT
jgi:phosphoglycerate dehydrogenase-like enzyme